MIQKNIFQICFIVVVITVNGQPEGNHLIFSLTQAMQESKRHEEKSEKHATAEFILSYSGHNSNCCSMEV
jgi:hypothetical protein